MLTIISATKSLILCHQIIVYQSSNFKSISTSSSKSSPLDLSEKLQLVFESFKLYPLKLSLMIKLISDLFEIFTNTLMKSLIVFMISFSIVSTILFCSVDSKNSFVNILLSFSSFNSTLILSTCHHFLYILAL